MDDTKHEIHIHRSIQGFVQGDYNTVTQNFYSGVGQIDWSARLTLVSDLRLESFKLGDTAAATFPYVVAPIQDIYDHAVYILNNAGNKTISARDGILKPYSFSGSRR